MAEDYHFNHDTDRPIAVEITRDRVSVTLADGRLIANPLDWHPWLRDASREQQARYDLRAFSVNWPDLDEGLDVEGMLRGIRPAFHTQRLSAKTDA